MIYFVRFYFNVPNFVHPNPKAADNPKTLIKVNIHISGSVRYATISSVIFAVSENILIYMLLLLWLML